MGTGPIKKFEGRAAQALIDRAETAERELEQLKAKKGDPEKLAARIAELEEENTDLQTQALDLAKQVEDLKSVAGAIERNPEDTSEVLEGEPSVKL